MSYLCMKTFSPFYSDSFYFSDSFSRLRRPRITWSWWHLCYVPLTFLLQVKKNFRLCGLCHVPLISASHQEYYSSNFSNFFLFQQLNLSFYQHILIIYNIFHYILMYIKILFLKLRYNYTFFLYLSSLQPFTCILLFSFKLVASFYY